MIRHARPYREYLARRILEGIAWALAAGAFVVALLVLG